MRIRRPLLASLLAATALLSPAVAQAAPGSAADRRAAREFAAATARFEAAARLQKGAIEARVEPLAGPGCFGPTLTDERVPERAQERLLGFFFLGIFDGIVTPLRPALDGFVADLARVPTRDAALRSGRAAWRRGVRLLASVPPAPGDLCAQVAAWRAAGYAAASAPQVDLIAFGVTLERVDGLERKLARAARRLRALGVPKRQAQRFTGEAILDEVTRDLFEDEATAAAARRLG